MANPWFRLWGDMVNDPKWRTIARVSKQEISRVLSVYLHMMTCASSAADRGHTEGWNDEDIATALDIDTEQVTVIREAMQGRVLDGDYLTGWEKRQPKREREEAPSTGRVREFRERQNHVTPCNANDNQETPREEEIREEEIKAQAKGAGAATSVDLSIAMRKAGIQSQPADPRLIALAEQGVTPETVEAACAEAKRTKPNESIGVGYVAKILERWAADAAALKVAGASAPQKQAAWWVTDASVTAKGDELGMKSLPGESMQSFKGRIQAAIDNGGKPPEQRAGPVIAIRDEGPKAVKPEGIGSLKSLIKTRDAA